MESSWMHTAAHGIPDQDLDAVRRLMRASIRSSSLASIAESFGSIVGGGKMLRARLALRVGASTGISLGTRTRVAAAVEMMHGASLCHDDVLDESPTRRDAPALWVEKGIKGAVLAGDLLVCRALELLKHEKAELIPALVELAGEMCEAEAEQELVLTGSGEDWDTSVSLARRKTGALFAFAACACGGSDREMCAALREAGYDIGTAYQLADDFMDAYGDPSGADKPLRNDAITDKITAASSWRGNDVDPLNYVDGLRDRSRKHLVTWPSVLSAWDAYLEQDIGPTIDAWISTFPMESTA